MNAACFRILLVQSLLATFVFCGCGNDKSSNAESDNYSSNVVASSSGTMPSGAFYSGIVVNAAGEALANARVVAYYDSKSQLELGDSVVTESDEHGNFQLQLDAGNPFVLFASKGDECGFANSDKKNIVVGKRLSMFSAHIFGLFTGYARIVGLAGKSDLDGDGYFVFYNVPPGDINLVYVDSGAPQAALSFETLFDREIIVLPELEILQDSYSTGKLLNIKKEECYTEEGCSGIRSHKR